MENNETFEEYFEESMGEGRGHDMWPDFQNVVQMANIYHFLWEEGYIVEGEFKEGSDYEEVNDTVHSEFGIKDYFESDGDMREGVDEVLNEMRNFAEKYAR